MEQKANRIGKLNIIDLIAIVLIVAVLALAAWKFLGKNGDSIDAELAQTKVTYQVKVEGLGPADWLCADEARRQRLAIPSAFDQFTRALPAEGD